MEEFLGRPYRPGPTLDGGVGSTGRTYKPLWPKLVRECLKRGIDPVHYVGSECVRGARPPYGNQLLSPQRMAAYKARESHDADPPLYVFIRTRSEVEWVKRQHAILQGVYGRSEADAWKLLLPYEQYGCSTLTRYCFAAAVGPELFEKVADQWEREALRQYMRNPDAYDEVWGRYLPNRLKELARTRIDYGWRSS